MNLKGLGRKRSGLIHVHPSMYLEGLGKTMKNTDMMAGIQAESTTEHLRDKNL